MKFRFFTICLFAVTTSTWAKTPVHWQTECVGRLQLDLPGKADQAALSFKGFRNKISPPNNLSYYPYAFTDGEGAEWTNYYFAAGLEISHPLTAIEKNEFLTIFNADKARVIKAYKAENIAFMELPLAGFEGAAWASSEYYLYAHFFVQDVALQWSVELTNQTDFETQKRNFQTILQGLRQRPIFNTPREPGVCLPYLFIRDDNQIRHGIAMTYRLTEHPDITINLVSRTARPTPAKDDKPETVTNEYNIGDYWAQRMMSVNQFVTLWHRPRSMRSVRLAGQGGLASLVSVIRKKGDDPDVIYRAVARGNPETPEAVPDVELVVEQERGNAIKRDIQPLTQNEVLNLAEQIAASIAVRPVK